MNTHTEKAAEFFLSGCGCAQAVLAAFTDVTGLDESTALRLASSFGGGMGRMREVCGACSAMFMVAGLLYGDYDPTDVKAKSTHYALSYSALPTNSEKNTKQLYAASFSAAWRLTVRRTPRRATANTTKPDPV